MNPLFVLTAVFAAASAAPAYPAAVGLAAVPAPGYALPAPFETSEVRGAPAVSVQQAAPVVTKQLHYADRTYVAGYDTTVLKPAIPDLRIAVPTALKGTTTYNAPIVKVATETHVVNEPVPVQKPYSVPYDVVKHVEQVVEVPTPVHVSRPYAVHRPVAVAGEPIVQKVRTAPVVQQTHSAAIAPAAAIHGGYAHAHGGYAHAHALPAAGYAHTHAGYTQAHALPAALH